MNYTAFTPDTQLDPYPMLEDPTAGVQNMLTSAFEGREETQARSTQLHQKWGVAFTVLHYVITCQIA